MLLEMSMVWSPYVYCGNNLVSRIDANGLADYFTPKQIFSDRSAMGVEEA